MKQSSWIILFFTLGLLVFLLINSNRTPHQPIHLFNTTPLPNIQSIEDITPLQPIANLPAETVYLGARLFIDPRLSKDNTVSCAHCHALTLNGADNKAQSIGVHGQKGHFNSPSVFNAAYNLSQFWDGRAQTLEEQISGPLINPIEMGTSWPDVIGKLKQDPFYNKQFKQLYQGNLSAETISHAIATYEKSLISLNSPFDRWLQGEENAISAQAEIGYQKFKSYGCIACHQGRLVGGNMYEKLGIVKDYFVNTPTVKQEDLGRFNVTQNEEDKYKFKVPSLRNITLTAPYFHDGSIVNLTEAIKIMGRYQLGIELDHQDVLDITSFLQTLTGEIPPFPKNPAQ